MAIRLSNYNRGLRPLMGNAHPAAADGTAILPSFTRWLAKEPDLSLSSPMPPARVSAIIRPRLVAWILLFVLASERGEGQWNPPTLLLKAPSTPGYSR